MISFPQSAGPSTAYVSAKVSVSALTNRGIVARAAATSTKPARTAA